MRTRRGPTCDPHVRVPGHQALRWPLPCPRETAARRQLASRRRSKAGGFCRPSLQRRRRRTPPAARVGMRLTGREAGARPLSAPRSLLPPAAPGPMRPRACRTICELGPTDRLCVVILRFCTAKTPTAAPGPIRPNPFRRIFQFRRAIERGRTPRASPLHNPGTTVPGTPVFVPSEVTWGEQTGPVGGMAARQPG